MGATIIKKNMNLKKIFTISFCSTLACGLLAGVVTHTESIKPVEVSAWSLDVEPDVDDTFYSACKGKTGTALKGALAGFNKPLHPSYDWDRYEAADEAYDDSDSILCVYTRHNIKKKSQCGSYSWDTWNREHVYTQSAFPNSKKDNHNIFACEGQINNNRGNLKFAEVTHNSSTRQVIFGHTTDCYKEGDYFEPCDEAKGEIARACLYCTVYYGYSLSSIFDSEETALKWNANFQVTPREIRRNNVVQGLQGNRNPFSDHPSYAQLIYGGPAYGWDDPVESEPITIIPVTGVSLSETTVGLYEGETHSLSATVSPDNATNKNVTWSSKDTSVATVSSSGLITAVGEGDTTITVTTEDGGFTDSVTVLVEKDPNVPVTGVTISPTTLNLNEGDTASVSATVSPSNATNKNVTYSSGNTTIATVSSTGSVCAISEGVVNITATTEDGGFTANCAVTVTKPHQVIHVESVSLNETEKEIHVGERFQLTATINPSNADNKDVVWSTEILDESEYSAVLVNSNGLVFGDREGRAKVIVTTVDGLKTAECIFTVSKKVDPPAPKPSSGCGGNIVTSSVIISALCVLGIGLLLIKRNKRSNKHS